MLKLFATVSAAALVCSAASASPFTFNDQLSTGQLVTGSFDGDLSGNLITNMTNISVFVDGIAFAGNGTLYAAQHTDGGAWAPGAVASLDGTQNDFIFVNSDLGDGVEGYTNFFYSLSGSVGDATITPNADENGYNVVPSNFRAQPVRELESRSAPAVPEPASWALMLGGFGLVGATLRSRRRSASVSFG